MKKKLFTTLMILSFGMLFAQSYDNYLAKANSYGNKNADDKGGSRTSSKTLSGAQGNNIEDNLVAIPGKGFVIGKTEVTQKQYEAVMGENPSISKGDMNPVENVSWYDAIYFCNKLSIQNGYAPVYAVDGYTDVTKWNYTPHKGYGLDGILTQDNFADGYRLPSVEEWQYAAKGGQDNIYYGGGNNLNEIAWYAGNSGGKLHPVAQKKANGYGLYDMSGNIDEFSGDHAGYGKYLVLGGSFDTEDNRSEIGIKWFTYGFERNFSYGFRVVRTTNGEERRLAEQKKLNEIIRGIKDGYLVSIPGKQYLAGKTEVTQKLYETIVGSNPSILKGENNPVENVSWYDAIYFCNKLSEVLGLTPVYEIGGNKNVEFWDYIPHMGGVTVDTVTWDMEADGFRLPTTDEWEFVAMGGKLNPWSGSNEIDEVGWYRDNSGNATHPVAQKKANDFGIYDMSGNVWEWCWNMNEFNQESFNRGGSFVDGSNLCNVTYSFRTNSRKFSIKNLGFRVFCNAKGKDKHKSAKEIESERLAAEKYLKKVMGDYFVSIPGKHFSIGKTEVTQKLYETVMGYNPSFFVGEDNPVEKVTWFDAIYFCNTLSEKIGLTPVYAVDGKTDTAKWNYTPHIGSSITGNITQDTSADGFRLPVTDEWEYAAIAGQNYVFSGSPYIWEVGWYFDNSGDSTHPVAQMIPNGYGLYDMTGNVREWCWQDAKKINYMPIRGGGFWDSDINCELYFNQDVVVNTNNFYMGFRLACNATAEKVKKTAEMMKNRPTAGEVVSEKDKKKEVSLSMVMIPGKKFVMSSTEITQKVYESIMGTNPSYFKDDNKPVESISWYDAIYFCNLLSEREGLKPVYAVDGKTDTAKWNYTPHIMRNSIKGVITQNTSADGYRLPTLEEWMYAATCEKNYSYSGSDNPYEVGWFNDNSYDNCTSPVALKKANDYGLYDMTGNVYEWVWDLYGYTHHYICGGSYSSIYGVAQLAYSVQYRNSYDTSRDRGFRVVRSVR